MPLIGQPHHQALDALPHAGIGAACIPLIDLTQAEETVAAAVTAACRDWGLFLVTGHGIDEALMQGCLGEMRRFFARPAQAKRRLVRTLENPWGYNDRELTKNIRDKKEVFDIGPEGSAPEDPFAGSTPWPAEGARLVAAMRAYKTAFEALADRLVRTIIAGLGEPVTLIEDAFRPAPTSFLRLNSYPVDDPLARLDAGPAGRAVHQHTDAGALTLLLDDGTLGLQVLHDGAWHDVRRGPGALVVNIGDMMQVWSNDLYRAPLHRVLAMESHHRYSAPYFCNPSYRATIAPLPGVAARTGSARYRPIPWAEFRRRRAEGDYRDYGQEVQIADYAI